jgi:hypothetical protein
MTDHNTSDFFHRAEFFLLRLYLFILLLLALAKFIWIEAALSLAKCSDTLTLGSLKRMPVRRATL